LLECGEGENANARAMNECMALFTRRVIQKCLDESAEFVTTNHLKDWVRRLNHISNDYVATEWEVVLLWAFARFGRVQHEPPLGPRPVDMVFESLDGNLKFAADIAAISDEPLHEKNPIERLQAELRRRVAKAKISTGRFLIVVREDQPIVHRETGRKRRLSLPSASQFGIYIFNAAFEEYIAAVQKEPQNSRHHHVYHRSPEIAVTIEYQPGNGSGAGMASYGSYTSTTVKDDNPLFNALKSKAAQLKKSGFDGIRGIIVCDRGSRMFNEMSNWATYSMDEVIREFFRQHTSVSFVVTIGIKSRASNISGRLHKDLEPRLFPRDAQGTAGWVAELDRLIVEVTRSLPEIYQTPENAINSLKWNRSTTRTNLYQGGWIVKGNEIRISARELLDLLAGTLDQKRFAQLHTLGNGNIFSTFQAHGKMIKRAAVEHRPDDDDDWIVLEFGADDPAVSDFRVPNSTRPKKAE
jgi:hypothetical protein